MPFSARFLSSDPLGFANGANRFVYVNNNPVLFTDPKGLKFPVLNPVSIFFRFLLTPTSIGNEIKPGQEFPEIVFPEPDKPDTDNQDQQHEDESADESSDPCDKDEN